MKPNRPPRICLVTGNFYPIIGGGEKHAFLLAREMINQGAAVTVVTRRRYRSLPKKETIAGIPVLRIGPCGFPRLGKYLVLPFLYRTLRKLRAQFDLVYVCGLRVLGPTASLAAKRLAKKCVLRSETEGEWSGGFIWCPNPGAPPRPFYRLCFSPFIRRRNKLLLAKADAWVSISDAVRSEFIDGGVPEKLIFHLTNGIDPHEFMPATESERRALRKELQLPLNATICAYSGKLNHGKGLQFLLELWRELVISRPQIHLLLIGSGHGQAISCEPELRQMILDYNLADKVTITGYIQNVPVYLRAADCYLFPSESETLALALLEALACELPAVASNIPGVADYLKDKINGCLARPNNKTEWLEAVNFILDNPDEARKLGSMGRQTVVNDYSIASVATRHLAAFDQILREK